ncbi:photosystem II cytochrome PsbV2 [Roseofilum sp. BLCC_M91]|uniref:Photosystem II cytochrome PsbV2 n=1 Tax=Roseofilum halophilum BLCC-M91 TaxID=3022259 RepID=A0ABT7BIJ3_9CYAN|nr:photosystem II cytochrome PsbV2 [Roseofilum halophilum]MDJ1179008.1 photosystem II cytochrome PsbV2 [Roseofilum halophilum BLCC-M91]
MTQSVQRWRAWVRPVVAIALTIAFLWTLATPSALASDRYVIRFLKALEPVEVPLDTEGNTQTVTPDQLSEGKTLFNKNCENCHLGGTTLLSEYESLSLESLHNASPPLDNISNMVGFLRAPLKQQQGYQKYACREVSPEWMESEEVENLSAFVIRAAQEVDGWGAGEF